MIQKQEWTVLKSEVEDSKIGMIFDGTTRVAECYCFIVRFVDPESFKIQQRLAGLRLLKRSLTGKQICGLLNRQITIELKIDPNLVVCAMHDRAATNIYAMEELSNLCPNMIRIGCFSHAINNCGDRFHCPTLKSFSEAFNVCVGLSLKARDMFYDHVGMTPPTGSKTRWWSQWEVYKKLLVNFGAMEQWIHKCREFDPNMCPSTMQTMQNILLHGEQRDLLQTELSVIVDIGEKFVTSTYLLEADGFVSVKTYRILEELLVWVKLIRQAINADGDEILEYLPNFRQLIRSLGDEAFPQMKRRIKDMIRPLVRYYMDRFDEDDGELKDSIALFKSLRMFDPRIVQNLNVSAEDIKALCKLSPFEELHDELVRELPAYLSECKLDCTINEEEHGENAILQWFKNRVQLLPAFAEAVKVAAIIQPSSAAAERVFSMLKSLQSDTQTSMLHDYQETSLMLRYNEKERQE